MTAESTLVFLYKLLRPWHMLLAVGTTVVAAYAASQHLSAPVWWNALGAAFFFAGIAFWHVGAAAQMYAVKESRRLVIRRQFLCIACGLSGFLITLVIANRFLPDLNHTLYAIDAGIIGFYAPVFCKHWALKNPPIAFACTVLILVGWHASGAPFTRETLYFCAILFSAISAREVVKDVEDVSTDKQVLDLYTDGGSRRTLATQFGTWAANRVAGVWCVIVTLSIIGWLITVRTSTPLFLLAVALIPACWFLQIAYQLVHSRVEASVASARIFHALAVFAVWLIVQRVTTTS